MVIVSEAPERVRFSRRLKALPLVILPGLTMIFAAAYVGVRTAYFVLAAQSFTDKVFAFALLGAEMFIFIHGAGYMINLIILTWRYGGLRVPPHKDPPLLRRPRVAVIVSALHEPIEMVERTLIAFLNLTYDNKRIYFLDDTRYDLPGQHPKEMESYRRAVEDMCERNGVDMFRRRWHGAKAGMINDFTSYLRGEKSEGFTYHNFSGKPEAELPVYLAVFDADQNPMPDFLEPLVARMEAAPSVAFIQTPQYYTNFEHNRVARASGMLQVVFYEYICEGKDLKGAMFACGTNVLFRFGALMEVGGFDEGSITEDFATSLKFHMKGWKSRYLGRVSAFGMGPEDLGGFFRQQYRWALGTIRMFRTVIRSFLTNPFRISPFKWWEYLLSSTHYLIGPVYLVLMLFPVTFLLFDIPTFFVEFRIYAAVFVPYIILTLLTFLWTLSSRRYGAKDILQGQLLMSITFPVYIKAALAAFFGGKSRFEVTPKKSTASLPLSSLLPQLGAALLLFVSVVWGVNRLIFEGEHAVAVAVNTFWSLLQFLVLLSVFYFNEPKEKAGDPATEVR